MTIIDKLHNYQGLGNNILNLALGVLTSFCTKENRTSSTPVCCCDIRRRDSKPENEPI